MHSFENDRNSLLTNDIEAAAIAAATAALMSDFSISTTSSLTRGIEESKISDSYHVHSNVSSSSVVLPGLPIYPPPSSFCSIRPQKKGVISMYFSDRLVVVSFYMMVNITV